MGGPLARSLACASVKRIFYVAILAGSACISAVCGQIICQESAKSETVQRCFDDQNITGPSLHDNKPGGTVVDAFITKQPKDFCLKKAKYKLAMACVLTQNINCMLPQLHGYLPQPNKMDAFVEKLCENVNPKDVDCIQSRGKQILGCHKRKLWKHYNQTRGGGMTIDNNTIYTDMCSNLIFYTACLSPEGRSCGCPVVEWYQQILREILYPPACQRPMPGGKDLVCTENSGVCPGLSWQISVSLVIFGVMIVFGLRVLL